MVAHLEDTLDTEVAYVQGPIPTAAADAVQGETADTARELFDWYLLAEGKI
jgi:hypothetical protein